MPKVGIVRCDAYADKCAGYKCFPATRDRAAAFAAYPAPVGFDTCGGCDRNPATKIVARAQRLKERGAEAIDFSKCLVSVCPWSDLFATSIREQVGIPVVRGTH